jgi:hypothetical protein
VPELEAEVDGCGAGCEAEAIDALRGLPVRGGAAMVYR